MLYEPAVYGVKREGNLEGGREGGRKGGCDQLAKEEGVVGSEGRE